MVWLWSTHRELPPAAVPAAVVLALCGVLGCALRTQYRSHAAISDWASRETYGGALAASPSVATRLLRDLPGVVATAATSASATARASPGVRSAAASAASLAQSKGQAR